ncbi:MAG: aldo/keto reductase [Burkholderiales bacterium]|nr:aldo/keto reductase [Burkholderiales bacterium]
MRITRRRFIGSALAAGAAAPLPQLAAAQAGTNPGGPVVVKPIPSSNELLPLIGLGTARRYENVSAAAEKAVLRDTVARFQALGGKMIDTAPTYGTAEALVGELVAGLGIRDALFLATKVSISGKQAGVDQIEQSFRNLRTKRIDLIAVHNLRDTVVHLQTLRDLRAAGRIRYIGITTSFDRQYPDFEATMKRETLDFIQVDYALDNREAGERILPLARDRGMAVMINLPFGRGRLFKATEGRPLPPWAAEFDCTSWAQFFLKYIVSNEAVTCAVPGMAQPKYADDNLQATRGRLPDAALRKRMEAFIDAL